ncbi:MAG TPA: hypothetical protein VFR03_11450 [Thermoanaerobaculia bacterium]|nr:hypothetical protein [Thermoanaerobaculia bacterium]
MSRAKSISPKIDARHARGPEPAPLRIREKVTPVSARWDEAVGPFYSAGQAARICGGTSDLEDRRKHRAVLGLTTADDAMVYPVFQFDDQNRVLQGLPEVLECFPAGYVDDWALAGWLVSPLRSLEGLSVVQWLREGRDLAPVLVLARDAARRFAQ